VVSPLRFIRFLKLDDDTLKLKKTDKAEENRRPKTPEAEQDPKKTSKAEEARR